MAEGVPPGAVLRMEEGERRRLRPFPAIQLQFGRDGVSTTLSERIAVGNDARTSGTGALKRTLEAAALRHADLSRKIAEQERVLAKVRRRLRLSQLFVARLAMGALIRRLVEQGESSIDALARDRAERDAGKVEVHFAIDTATVASYAALARAFEDLAEHDRIWEVSATWPDGQAEPAPLSFSVGPSDIVACHEDVLTAPRAGGGSLQIFPGFVLLRGGSQAIVLEHGEVELDLERGSFAVEDEELPHDAKPVDRARPQRRSNAKAARALPPLVEFGRITIHKTGKSLDDLTDQLPIYVFSSFAKARVFVEAYEDYQRTLAAIIEPEPQPAGRWAQSGIAPRELPLDVKPRTRLWLDWVTIVVIVFLLGLPFALPRPAPTIASAPLVRPVAAAHAPDAKRARIRGRASDLGTRRPKRANARAGEIGRASADVAKTRN